MKIIISRYCNGKEPINNIMVKNGEIEVERGTDSVIHNIFV